MTDAKEALLISAELMLKLPELLSKPSVRALLFAFEGGGSLLDDDIKLLVVIIELDRSESLDTES